MASSNKIESLNGAEQEVNEYFRLNNLTRLSRSTAIWTALTCAEDLAIRPFVQGHNLTAQEDHVHSDYIINIIRYPLRWVSGNAEQGGYTPTFDGDRYADGQRLLDLAWNYENFACAFTYTHHGDIDIELDGTVLKPIYGFLDRPEYEAYGFLSMNVADAEANPLPPELGRDFEKRVRVKRTRFNYDVNPTFVRDLISLLRPLFLSRFQLPLNLRFSRYTLEEFAETYLTLLALSSIALSARLVAIQKGCDNFGIADSLIIQSREGLLSRVIRYSGLPTNTSRHILEDLTYGGGGIVYPDPAIQPLVRITHERLAIMPSIILNSSVERNLCVLLNRLAHERAAYRVMANQKEGWLKDRIAEKVRQHGLRTWSGKVPGRKDLGDIDLAIIDEAHSACLLCELKWFVNPSDPREWIEKGEEIRKGISQALALRNAYAEGCPSLAACLGISDRYRLSTVVATPGWIGQSTLQDDRVPVVGTSHLLTKLTSSDLPAAISWLERRSYLPVPGKHFSVVQKRFNVGRWQLAWYGIKPLVGELFRPIE